MAFRNEWKHEINMGDVLVLRQRLRAVMKPDPIAGTSEYAVRSLYFDTPENKAYWEKINGVNRREKFRIRYYNGDTGFIRLEKKCKVNGLCEKLGTMITTGEVESLLRGDIEFLRDSGDALKKELYVKMVTEHLAPKTIVDYSREAYTFPAGNVRCTIDSRIRVGLSPGDFLDPDCTTVPAAYSPYMLEVKWDGYLPSHIKEIVGLPGREVGAFSKYTACAYYHAN